VNEDPLRVAVEHLRDQPYNPNDDHLKATTLEIVSTLKELLHLHPLYNEQLRSFAAFGGDFHDLSRLADMGASLTSADEAALQSVLEELSVPSRCAPSAALMEWKTWRFVAAVSRKRPCDYGGANDLHLGVNWPACWRAVWVAAGQQWSCLMRVLFVTQRCWMWGLGIIVLTRMWIVGMLQSGCSAAAAEEGGGAVQAAG
jgi:hypothetical protein